MRRYELFLLVGDKPCKCSRSGCTRRLKRFVRVGKVDSIAALMESGQEMGHLMYYRGHTAHRRYSGSR